MKETTYNWIEAIKMMDQDPECYMSVGATYRIRDGVLQVYSGDSHWRTSGEEVKNLCGYTFRRVDNPEPKYTRCTWQEACALRTFIAEQCDAIKFTSHSGHTTHWTSEFVMNLAWRTDGAKFAMLTELYNKYFR